ncbi:hypothetical protein BCR33DRAFT_722066 [Rhizoclosmatium globosum]|uniref:Uncharacterized protein n=1 Tax=Rhizoclosmatium globosum TaxID=329046 RepID=A0A1Y2BP78_9FUNG|nr:hypothetical protein BCR33DRAFT_722066 [Rhizoclosmatium globosum]|eukprot:ORY36558.1 hypothetical protein BCR33DRAFT_722066 [Rhizoclosmatium globosum]
MYNSSTYPCNFTSGNIPTLVCLHAIFILESRNRNDTTKQPTKLSRLNLFLILACTSPSSCISEIFFLCLSEQFYIFFARNRSFHLIKMHFPCRFNYLAKFSKYSPLVLFLQLIPWMVQILAPDTKWIQYFLRFIGDALGSLDDFLFCGLFETESEPNSKFKVIAWYGCVSSLLCFCATALYVANSTVPRIKPANSNLLVTGVYLFVTLVVGSQVRMKVVLLNLKKANENSKRLEKAIKASLKLQI